MGKNKHKDNGGSIKRKRIRKGASPTSGGTLQIAGLGKVQRPSSHRGI